MRLVTPANRFAQSSRHAPSCRSPQIAFPKAPLPSDPNRSIKGLVCGRRIGEWQVGQRPTGHRGRPGGENASAQSRRRACPGGLTDSALAASQDAYARTSTKTAPLSAVADDFSEQSITLGVVNGTAERAYYFGQLHTFGLNSTSGSAEPGLYRTKPPARSFTRTTQSGWPRNWWSRIASRP